MFRKILIISMFATAAGYCFAAETLPQVVTSEVFYKDARTSDGYDNTVATETNMAVANINQNVVPVWPIAGSDADMQVSCDGKMGSCGQNSDNIKIVSKIGSDLVVENNINMGTRGEFNGWSGGANMLHGKQIPVGFDDCDNMSEMPLLHREMLEDDGGEVLAVSRSARKRCGGTFAMGGDNVAAKNSIVNIVEDEKITDSKITEFGVDQSADAVAPKEVPDQVRSWVVASGQTLREVLQSWCDKEGWDLVWATPREYPIEASAVFKGRFVDVSSALVRNFGRAIPIPYAKFYKGNRVLVVSTTEE